MACDPLAGTTAAPLLGDALGKQRSAAAPAGDSQQRTEVDARQGVGLMLNNWPLSGPIGCEVRSHRRERRRTC